MALYAAIVVFHMAFGLVSLTSSASFENPALEAVTEFASPVTWGAASLVVAAALFCGAFTRSYFLARSALAAGALITALRMLLLCVPAFTGGSLTGMAGAPAWWLVAAIHLQATALPSGYPNYPKG